MSDYQWYPGHMTKAVRMMKEALSSVEMVAELVDARIPQASRNPDIDGLCKGKKRLLILNKADLADDAKTEAFLADCKSKGQAAIAFCSKKQSGKEAVFRQMRNLMHQQIAKDQARGLRPEIRVMVAGIPNVGKSAFINNLAGKRVAKTENRPGVTRGKQWITLDQDIRLLDTPGILWPKFADQKAAERLAIIGSMNDHNLDLQNLAYELVVLLEQQYPGTLSGCYGYSEEALSETLEEDRLLNREAAIIGTIAKKRGLLKRGGIPDYEKASETLLAEFRNGRMGKITLETL